MTIISSSLQGCLDHIADHFGLPIALLNQYASEAPYADKLPNRTYPKATGTPSERRILYALARLAKPVNALECGVNWGVSTTQIASALQRNQIGTLHAVDIRKAIEGGRNVGYIIPSNLRSCVKIHAGISAVEYIKTQSEIDYFFEDTDHTFDTTRAIYEAILPLLSQGAWCISHDPFNCPAVVRAQVDLGLDPIVYIPDGTENGLSIWRK